MISIAKRIRFAQPGHFVILAALELLFLIMSMLMTSDDDLKFTNPIIFSLVTTFLTAAFMVQSPDEEVALLAPHMLASFLFILVVENGWLENLSWILMWGRAAVVWFVIYTIGFTILRFVYKR